MSTLITLYPKVLLKDLKSLTPSLLLCMFMYSLKSPFEQEKNYKEDQNLFLTDFLMEVTLDYQSMVSIRSTVIDFLDEVFQHSEFNKQTIEHVIVMLATGTFTLGGLALPPCNVVAANLRSRLSIADVNTEIDVFIPDGFLIVKQELALFLTGAMQDNLNISESHIRQCLSMLAAESSLLLKLRALWLLEKLAMHDSLCKKGSPLVKEIFQIITDLFVASSDFVLNYQYLKTLHKYIKQIDLKATYPNTYQQLVSMFM